MLFPFLVKSMCLYRGYCHPGVHFGPCFSKKIEKFFTPGQDQILRTRQQKQNEHTLCFFADNIDLK